MDLPRKSFSDTFQGTLTNVIDFSKVPDERTFRLPVNYNRLTPQERRVVREQYADLQGGNCHHCKAPLHLQPTGEMFTKPINTKLFPAGFFNHPVHLHHSHKTGMTIGAVHCRCNAVLWQYHGE